MQAKACGRLVSTALGLKIAVCALAFGYNLACKSGEQPVWTKALCSNINSSESLVILPTVNFELGA